MDQASIFDFDVAIIGGGSAGYAAARTAGDAGLKTMLIEGGQEVGGLCILRGCMPTKALLQCSDVIHAVKSAPVFGVHPSAVAFDFEAVMARKHRLIADFADYRRQQLAKGRFEFVRASARFVDPHTLQVGARTVTARHFIVCTGSVIAPNPVPGLEAAGYITSDDALALRRLPKSLIVLGGGAVAIEFAQFFVRFGVNVTLIQRSEQILREFDPDATAVVEAVLRREGIALFTGTRLTEAFHNGDQKGVVFEHQGKSVRIEADEILFALGRVPNTEPLRLETARVSIEQGRILTNPAMQTSATHIYAAGDCTGRYEIVHLAVQEGEVAAHNIAHPSQPREMDYRLLTTVVFSDPHLAAVGLTEKAAKLRRVPYLAASYPFADHGKSLIMEALDGFVKLLADPETGEIIGGTVVGPHGGELIHEIIAAMAKRMTVHELAVMPHYHPTLAEIWTYPAEELASKVSAKSA